MNGKMEEIAKAAQKANTKGWTFDDFIEAVLEGTRQYAHFTVHAFDGFIKMQSHDLPQIYEDYAKEIGKDELTKEEKQVAFLNHVLEQDE